MQAYTSGDYVYFNNMTDKPKRHHIGFILNQMHDMYVTPPLNITEVTFAQFSELFVKNILEPWMNSNIQVVAQLSKVNIWNQIFQQMEKMYTG